MYRHNETNEIWTIEELTYHFNWFKDESEYMGQFARDEFNSEYDSFKSVLNSQKSE